MGVIHGRFQILHNDHARYLLVGKKLCRHLIVGITNPDPLLTAQDSTDPQRSSSLSNPLTYYERFVLVNSVLKEKGVALDEFSVVPFPINHPWVYRYYVPLDAVFFLSIYDDWTRKKLDLFNSLKLKVHVLREVSPMEKGISATEVRERMIADQSWEDMVPDSVSALMEKWDVPQRLKNIHNEE
jgi:nicotinamide-nucleotide adenylyltransferase